MDSRSIYNIKIDTIYMYDMPFDRSFLQLSNGIRHVMPSTDSKPELTTKASMAQPVSQPAVYANGLMVSGLKQHPPLLVGQGLIIHEVSRSHITTHHI
jgi:hypothetical protein